MIGKNIKILRKLFSLTQTEFAKSINVSKQCVSDWENNRTELSLDIIIKIADYYKVSTDFLLGRSKYCSVYTYGLNSREICHLREIALDLLANKK